MQDTVVIGGSISLLNGIYVNAATVTNNTMTLTFYYRYNSNHTGTINGNYTARVYGVKLYDLIGG